jgi:hypothetical protein
MLDKVVEFWLLRAAPAGRRRNEAASATSQLPPSTASFRLVCSRVGGGSLAPLVRARCGALVDVIEMQQDVASAARGASWATRAPVVARRSV